MSTFQWLWWHAGAGARENFTTEALALAINADFRPLTRLAKLRDATDPADDLSRVVAYTQRSVGRSGAEGHLDLVVDFDHGSDRRTVWVEVKVGAGESGDQIDTYIAARSALPGERKPLLVQLGGWKAIDDRVPWVTWADLAQVISDDDGFIWQDFRNYLHDAEIVTDSADPIRLDELAALPLASSLVRKMGKVVEGILGAPELELKEWILKPGVYAQLSGNLRHWGELRVGAYSPSWRIYIGLGLFRRGTTFVPAVRVGNDARQRPVRDALLNAAAEAGVAADYELTSDSEWAITRWASDDVVRSGRTQDWMFEAVLEMRVRGLLDDRDESGRRVSIEEISPGIDLTPLTAPNDE